MDESRRRSPPQALASVSLGHAGAPSQTAARIARMDGSADYADDADWPFDYSD